MSEGAKIALIAGGVAVAGYFVVKAVAAPRAVPTGTAPSSTTTAFISGIVSGIGGFFSHSPSAPNAPLTNIGTPNANPYGITDPNFSSEGIDPTTGGVVLQPDQVYGPFPSA